MFLSEHTLNLRPLGDVVGGARFTEEAQGAGFSEKSSMPISQGLGAGDLWVECMCVCVCVNMYPYMSICVYVCSYVPTYVCVHGCVCMSVYCVFISICVCVCVFLCVLHLFVKGVSDTLAQISWHKGVPGKRSGWRKGPGNQVEKEIGILWG